MASAVVPVTFHLLIVFTLVYISDAKHGASSKIFNIQNYGAVADDGKTDISEALLKAWNDACEWNGVSEVLIPEGKYMLEPITLIGFCRSVTRVVIKGYLKALTNQAKFFSDHWITFQYVDQLVVKGGGDLDGFGSSAWSYNDCNINPQCKPLPATMRFDFVTNSRVNHLKSKNSKNAHFILFACENMNISRIRITAPGDSPNTDGIKIGASNNIRISRSVIGTGDDCIAMINGTYNVNISEVSCGPGHGISVGSLGSNESVSGINVKNCSIMNTTNGLRIKTKAPSLFGSVSNLIFEDVFMQNVFNPIIVDQNYCPRRSCNFPAQSGLQISNLTFRNIHGTSNSKIAVNINCSKDVPCQNVTLENINLAYNGRGGPATSSCSNLDGKSYGTQVPSGCL